MPKSLILCCDGTWNTPDQKCPTNVTKIALALADTGEGGHEQRIFYHRGVGSTPGERLRGGAFGIRPVTRCARRLPVPGAGR
jgi:uncharacterized protein (DUF2235 family)